MAWFPVICRAVFALFAAIAATNAQAGLTYDADQTSDGLRFVMVQGQFAFDDNLDEFAAVVRTHNPSVVSFNSPGGNVAKAMELGRLIRSFRLSTFQLKGLDCSSACALAFLGGVIRLAQPGAIGVHKSSFSEASPISTHEAVSAVQQLTADVMTYMIEMGVDPALLQLSLQYDSDDIRYLSRSEMERFRVVTTDQASQPQTEQPTPSLPQQPNVAANPAPTGQSYNSLAIPDPRSGRVRHPKGQAPLKALAEGKSANVANVQNGTPVTILADNDRWYRLQVGSLTGYMHHTWVYVDQYDSGPFSQRHIQVKSVDNLIEAETIVRSSPVALSAYLATNGWFAITLEKTYDQQVASNLALVDKGYP
ncbi:hypothetical protein EET67_24510 [Pseudaminobacter arsenicus]|uniref:SH3b domain-containing protein n=1 Tax=Borborobacter arsenicus TaxID=1851146 RepID=A0A432UZ61_9HYPH|nr:hypothetical protein [Pseudaminobacter arsenicus]RUM95216.1 hypothetical protein EET67_24510 [Pseudaminobacter arsenicus]